MTNFKWPNKPLISFCRLAPPIVIPVLEDGTSIYSVAQVKDWKSSPIYLLPSHIRLVRTTTQTYPGFCYSLLSPHLTLAHALVISLMDHFIQASPSFSCFWCFSSFDSFLIQKPKSPFKNMNQIILFFCLKPTNGWLSL